VTGSSKRRAAIWALLVMAVLAAAAWGALALSRTPEGIAAPLPTVPKSPEAPQASAPTQTPLPTVQPPTPLPTASRPPEPTPTATLYVISAVEVAPRTLVPEPQPTAEPGEAPEAAIGRIEIPALGVNQPIVPVSWRLRVIDGQPVAMWDTVSGAVGHHRGSAGLGEPGNTVLTGHTRGDGMGEFQNLWDLQEGQEVWLYDAQGNEHVYLVESVNTLQEIGLTVEQRQENARYLQPTDDTRVTLVTCWPEWVYSHRVIVIAKPQ
jgi:sortase A